MPYDSTDSILKEFKTQKKEHEKHYWPLAQKAWNHYTLKNGKTNFQNIFWSDIKTLLPNLFFNAPKTKFKRRRLRHDPVASLACEILEENINFSLDNQNFRDHCKDSVRDRLVGGRGQLWIDYDFKPIEQIHNIRSQNGIYILDNNQLLPDQFIDQVEEDENGRLFFRQQIVDNQEALIRRLPWQDFIHGGGRCWDEVEWVARPLFMTEKDLVEFLIDKGGNQKKTKEIAENLTKYYDREAHGNEQICDHESEGISYARIWEIHHRGDGQIYYINENGSDDHKGENPGLLVKKEPRISFRNGFPCPKPLTATVQDGKFLPIPDYNYYDGDIESVAVMQARRDDLADMVKVLGFYNESLGGKVKDLLKKESGTMMPLENWSAFIDKNAWEGNIATFPVEPIIKAIQFLDESQAIALNNHYEMSGISDIMRGNGDPRATATSENIKQGFANIRIAEVQQDVTHFILEAQKIHAEVISEIFTDKNLLEIADLEPEKMQLSDQAIQLIRSDKMRTLKMDIETDTLLRPDQPAQRAEAVEFLNAFQQLVQALSESTQISPHFIEGITKVSIQVFRKFNLPEELLSEFEEIMWNVTQDLMQQQQAAQQQQQAEQQAQQQQEPAQIDPLKAKELQIKEQQLISDNAFKAREILKDESAEAHKQKIAELEIQIKKMQAEIDAIDKTDRNAITAFKTASDKEVSEIDQKFNAFKLRQEAAQKLKESHTEQAQINSTKYLSDQT